MQYFFHCRGLIGRKEEGTMREITAPPSMREAFDLDHAMVAYGTDLLRLCTLYLGDRTLAEDAVQDTFFRAWRSGGFRGESGEKTWLTRIAINVCKSYLLSPWHKRRADGEALAALLADVSDGVDDTLIRAVLSLAPKYRAVVLLHYYEGYKAREIAQLLHVRTNTVVSRLKRAREQLKPMLKEWYYEENI